MTTMTTATYVLQGNQRKFPLKMHVHHVSNSNQITFLPKSAEKSFVHHLLAVTLEALDLLRKTQLQFPLVRFHSLAVLKSLIWLLRLNKYDKLFSLRLNWNKLWTFYEHNHWRVFLWGRIGGNFRKMFMFKTNNKDTSWTMGYITHKIQIKKS